MKKSGMTYYEAVKISLKKELQIGNPWRIINLAFWTVYLTVVYRPIAILIPRAIRAFLMFLLNNIPGIHAEIKDKKRY